MGSLLVGLVATYPAAWVLNRLAAAVVGIDGLVQVSPLLPLLGVGMAVAIGTLGVVVAGRRIASLDPLVVLEGR